MPDGLGHALLQACSRFNHATALQAPGSAVTYRALAGQAQAAAKGLRAAGLRADEPVLVMVSNQPGDIAALLAVWLAGGVLRCTATTARRLHCWPGCSSAPAPAWG